MNRKTAILIVDFPYIPFDAFETGVFKIIKTFIVDFPYYPNLKKLTNITLVSLTAEKGSHLDYCLSANKFFQDELYQALGEFTNVIIITEIGGIAYGTLTLPKICENLFNSGKNIYLLSMQASKFMGKKRLAMGKIALEYSNKYLTKYIELPTMDYFLENLRGVNIEERRLMIWKEITEEIYKIVNMLKLFNKEGC